MDDKSNGSGERMLTNRSMPECSVMPELCYPDVEKAAEWLCAAFGFTVRIAMGSHRAQLNVCDGAVAITQMRDGEVSCQAVLVRVPNVEQHYEHALQCGAKILRPPVDYPYGERQYSAMDFAGHHWTFSQTIADVSPEEWGGVSGAGVGG
jgi:uncharacterized glyoxalase superfamily protein PhnB